MDQSDKRKDWLGWAVLLGITAVAFYLRLEELDLKPMHHDEGVNSQFETSLVNQFRYRYNPYNFHGPLLYFLAYPVTKLFGIGPETMRIMPVIFGTLAVPAFALVRHRIGWLGTIFAALLMAVAPVELYFSRTIIHEIYNGVFNITLVGGIYYWWQYGKRSGLYLGAASLAALFATKETTVITLAAMGPALLAVWYFARPIPRFPGGSWLPRFLVRTTPRWWQRDLKDEDRPEANLSAKGEEWPPKDAPLSVKVAAKGLESQLAAVREAARAVVEAHKYAAAQSHAANLPPPPTLPWGVNENIQEPSELLAKPLPWYARLPVIGLWITFLVTAYRYDRKASRWAIGIFMAIMILTFSSFFTHLPGLYKFFEAFYGWTKTGVEGQGHQKVWSYWIEQLLLPYYMPLLVVAIPALIIGSLKRDAFSLFNLVWFALALTAYSFIPYKTPWCVISFSGPLFFGVGIAVKGLIDGVERFVQPSWRPILVGLPLLVYLVPIGTYAQDSRHLQLEEYDVDGHAFIYVQNIREYMDLTHDVAGIFKAAELADDEVDVWLCKARNPLRYYVPEIADVPGSPTWNDKNKKKAKKSDLVIVQRSNAKDARKVFKKLDYVHRWYHERPGHKFDMFIKKDLWETYQNAVKRGLVPPTTEKSKLRTKSDELSKSIREEQAKYRIFSGGKKKRPVKKDKKKAAKPKK